MKGDGLHAFVRRDSEGNQAAAEKGDKNELMGEIVRSCSRKLAGQLIGQSRIAAQEEEEHMYHNCIMSIIC